MLHMAKKKHTQTRDVHRWDGYYIEDMDCLFCLYFQGRKRGCPLPVCCCLEEQIDAEEHGRIRRKPGSMRYK